MALFSNATIWGTVNKADGHIHSVESATSKEMAETILMANWPPEMKARYEIKRLKVKESSQQRQDEVVPLIFLGAPFCQRKGKSGYKNILTNLFETI